MLSIEDMASYCKKKGFIFRSSDIYGGFSGFFDFGPLGVELFNNLKANFWNNFVQSREDVVGIEGSIISHPKVWEASGHLATFGDLLLTCSKCKKKIRADHFIEEKVDMVADGLATEKIDKIITKHKLACPTCNGKFNAVSKMSLLFPTHVGASKNTSSEAYLRGETAQSIFYNFKLIAETTRQKLPFGVAQIGTCFRNEISARDFLFRAREFPIGEIEFFLAPEESKCDLLNEKHLKLSLQVLDAETQNKGKKDLKEYSIQDLVQKKKLGEWHAYWLAEQQMWLRSLGLQKNNLKIREHVATELSHYSSATFDTDYLFPFGSKEIAGNANRGQYDLNQHIKYSNAKLHIQDVTSGKNVVPRVIEPTFGITRVMLAVLFEAYTDDKKRGNIILKLNPELAPYKVAVFPLVNKVHDKARAVFKDLQPEFMTLYDKSGSVGRRYARADEIGVPYCVTVDFDQGYTIRDRDSGKQIRVEEGVLVNTLMDLLRGKIEFLKAGTIIKQ
jgi:glycyl-tRNA synthetase